MQSWILRVRGVSVLALDENFSFGRQVKMSPISASRCLGQTRLYQLYNSKIKCQLRWLNVALATKLQV